MMRGTLDPLMAKLRQVPFDRWVIAFIVPLLLIISLFLPPVALGNRLFHWGEPLVTPEGGGEVVGPYGARLHIPAGAVVRSSHIRLDALDVSQVGISAKNADFLSATSAHPGLNTPKANGPETLALAALPEGVLPFNPLFRLTVWGKESPQGATLALPIPYDLPVERADLYGWDGTSWRWFPSSKSADGMTLTANLAPLPKLLMLAEGLPQSPEICLGLEAEEAASGSATNADRLSISRLVLGDDDRLVGDGSIPQSLTGKAALLTISNERDGVVRSDLVDNLIIDPARREAHIQAIVAQVSSDGWSGVDLDYRGVDAALRDEFSAFVSALANALHQANRALVVRVDRPTAAGDGWNTGAYDWVLLGQVADRVRIPAFADPAAYAEAGAMDRLLAWATNVIARQKIELMLTAYSHDVLGDQPSPITYRQALAKLASAIRPQNAAPMMLPGQSLRFGADDPALLAVTLDEPSQTYWFRYKDDAGRLHTIWLENGLSTLRKLRYISRYALGGVFLEGALNPENDESVALLVENMDQNPQPATPQFAYVWTVQNQAGQTVSQQVVPLDKPDFVWTASNQPGQYVIGGSISDDGGRSTVGNVVQLPVLVPSPTFTPTPTSTPTPTPTPTSTPTPTATPKPTAAPQAAAQVQAVAPRGGASFAYGIQAHIFGDDQRIYDHVKALGFTWVKQQVEWFRYNPAPGVYNWGDLDRIVDGATANGLNVLLSVVKAPDWARGPAADHSVDGPPQNLQTFADFMGAMAARYKGRVKAYEIWNEQNLHYEWGNEPLDPGRYVAMLKLAYNAIKAADPSAYVISGALTPTGAPPPLAMDDFTYLELMYQAGLKNYCDGVGVHPSGYNVPPDAPWPGYTDPGASFRGPFDGGSAWHHSWSFKATMEGYRNIMVKYGDGGKRLWPTEFGWASVENLGAGPAPGYGYAADNTEAEQAQYIVTAYRMAKNWGWVGPMFLWNLNFAPASGRANEKAAFSIVREDWSPRPAFHALASMPK